MNQWKFRRAEEQNLAKIFQSFCCIIILEAKKESDFLKKNVSQYHSSFTYTDKIKIVPGVFIHLGNGAVLNIVVSDEHLI